MKSILTKTALTIALTASLVPFTTGIAEVKVGEKSNIESAQAWGKWWEHRFKYIGAKRYDQATGDRKCWEAFIALRGDTQDWEFGFGKDVVGAKTVYRQVKAWDGWTITWSNHIWYHRSQGYCVANEDHFYW